MNMEKQDEMPAIDLTISEKLDSYEELLESMKKQAFADDYLEKKSDPYEEQLASMKKQALENFYQFFQEKEKELLSIRKKQRPTNVIFEFLMRGPINCRTGDTRYPKKQDEILAVDPTITNTEAETFPAATSSHAVGIVEEEAAETIPQVLEKKSDPYEKLQELLSLQSSPLDSYKELPSFWKKQAFAEDTIRPTHVIEYLKRFHDSLPIQYLKRCPIYCRTGDTRYPKKNREPNLLPLSSKDSANTSIEQKVLTWEAFLCVVGGMLDISPQQHGILLMICIGFLSYYAKNSTTPFDMQFGKTTTTPVQSLISFSEAIYAFLPEITHITKFIICYVLSWMLVLPLRPGMQIFLVLLLISAPIFYFPELVHKASASGVHVACGSFKLPLIGFATLGAVGLSLICGFVTLLMVYLRWRFIYKGKPRVRAIEVSLDGLSEILQG